MSTNSVEYAGQGQFTVTSSDGTVRTMNIASLRLLVRADQMATLDQQIADQYQAIMDANQMRKDLNELLTAMRTAKDQKKDSNKYMVEINGESKSIEGWRDEYGLGTWTARAKDRSTEYNTAIESVKSKIDSISSDTELKMLRLRKMTDDRSTAAQDANSAVQKFSELMQRIASGR